MTQSTQNESPRIALPLALFATLLSLVACGGGGGGGTSEDQAFAWREVQVDVSPSRAWAGSTLFVSFATEGRVPFIDSSMRLKAENNTDGQTHYLIPKALYPIQGERGVRLAVKLPASMTAGSYTLHVYGEDGIQLASSDDSLVVEDLALREDAVQALVTDDGNLHLGNALIELTVDQLEGSLIAKDRETGAPLLLADRLRAKSSGFVARSDNQGPVELHLEQLTPYSVRAVARMPLGPTLSLERVIEMSDGPHVYVTNYLRTNDTVEDLTLDWQFDLPSSTRITKVTASKHDFATQARILDIPGAPQMLIGKVNYDVMIREPQGSLGGLDDNLSGVLSMGKMTAENAQLVDTLVVSGALRDKDDDFRFRAMSLTPDDVFVTSRVFTVGHPTLTAHDFYRDGILHRVERNPFYPRLGRLSQAVNTGTKGYYTFINWNNFQYGADLAPLHLMHSGGQTLYRDLLIRMSDYLADRLRQDNGWPKWFAWHLYPEGQRFTPHARAFPFMIYTWGLLTQQEGRQTGFERDLYDALQSTRPYFQESSPVHFVDWTEDGQRYISYASYFKQRDESQVQEVVNSHAHAYRFVNLMREMSELEGENVDTNEWATIQQWADEGSERLFEDNYPAIDPNTLEEQYGFIGYRTTYRRILKLAYNGISMMGLADSFQHAGTDIPALVEVVEQTTTDYRLDRSQGDASPAPWKRFLGKIYRANPLSLAFAYGAEGAMSDPAKNIEYASLGEVLSLQTARAAHDPSMAITIDHGKTIALTNNPFQAEWTPGFFDEVAPASLDNRQWFSVEVLDGDNGEERFWAAKRQGDEIQVMANFEGTVRIKVRVPPAKSLLGRVDVYQDHEWTPGSDANVYDNSGSTWIEATYDVKVAPKDRVVVTID